MDKKDNNENRKMNQKILISFAVGVVLGGGLMWLLIGTEVLSPSVDGITDVNGVDTIIDKDGNTIEDIKDVSVVGTDQDSIVANNQLDGDRVLLSEVEVTEPSWVVVHEESDGVLGNVLGAARLDPGTYSGSYVDLLRNTVTGSTYHILLYRDNGDKEFSLDDDIMVVDSKGVSIGTTFEAIRVDRKTD